MTTRKGTEDAKTMRVQSATDLSHAGTGSRNEGPSAVERSSVDLPPGEYVGQVARDADGRIYEWVEGVDGLGQPVGFWKAIKAAGRTAKRVAGKAAGAARMAAQAARRALDPIRRMFQTVVSTNIASAERERIPRDFVSKLRQYASDRPDDGGILLRALRRRPRFHRGGWILDLQPGASAMTLGRHVFVRPGVPLSPRLFVHEMVHVAQYARLGVTGFLASYFGLSALNVLKRMLKREPLDVMRSSPHEREAYAIDERFCRWCRSRTPGGREAEREACGC